MSAAAPILLILRRRSPAPAPSIALGASPIVPLYTILSRRRSGLTPITPTATRAAIREAIAAALKADPAVAALVAARVYPLVVPTTGNLPAIAVQLIGLNRPRHLRGPTTIVSARVQIAAVSKLQPDCVRVTEAVRQALDGFAGTLGAGANSVFVVETVLADERDLDEPTMPDGTKRPYVRTIQDYVIRYREPNPTRLG